MELSKLISLVIASLYLLFLIFFLVVQARHDGLSAPEVFECIFAMLLWLGISLGCIWWGDELGEGLTGARFGLISSPSPGWAVRMMGWIFLALPAVLPVVIFLIY
jgi:hypothetical protein